MKFFVCLFFVYAFSYISAQEIQGIEYLLNGAMVNEIAGDKNEMWVATYGRGIYHYDGKNWENYSTQTGNLQQDFFYCITMNKDYVWAGSSDGLFTLDRKRNEWRKRKFGMGGELGNWIRAIKYDKSQNVVWIGRFKYLTKLDISKQRFTDFDMTINNDVKTNNIKKIELEGDSLVWFCTESGIHKYNKSFDLNDKSSLEFYSNKENNFNGEGDAISVSAILFEQKNIWFGLDEFVTVQRPNFNIGGIYIFNRRARWDRIDESIGLNANGIYCLAKTGNYIWASTYEFNKNTKEQVGQGIAIINRATKEIKKISKDDLKLHSDKILSMFFDGYNMWLGTDNGLIRISVVNQLAQFGNNNNNN